MNAIQVACLFLLITPATLFAANKPVEHDAQHKSIVLSSGDGNLVLRLSYDGHCKVEQLRVRGRDVLAGPGASSGIKMGGEWFTSAASLPQPLHVAESANSLTVSGILLGPAKEVSETWHFAVEQDGIRWQIDRTYEAEGSIEDSAFPGFDFRDLSTWTGALLGHGGVAWGKLFDNPNSTYGVHNGNVTFWNREDRSCLRITPVTSNGGQVNVRFTRQPGGPFSCVYSVGMSERVPQHGLSRFVRKEQDVWRPLLVKKGAMRAEFILAAVEYDQAYARGTLHGLDVSAIREICHTIARIGAVDEHIMGSNGFYSDCAVLHEPWIAQLGLAIQDPNYTRAFSDTIDFQREHALGPDGRVKSRWAGRPGDSMPGKYDSLGYYECQWGWLMDSQPSWVINVAEQFDFTGDLDWLKRQKTACERALDFLLGRDTDQDGLLEMFTDSVKEGKGSDWIDVVWAAHENALVNAQMFYAMSLWSELEELLGDSAQAGRYRSAAAKLKSSFNRTTVDGGFWVPSNRCYAYWRDKDGSIHGTNGVVPVNFSAIGYGLCDDSGRKAMILEMIENQMQQEKLFFWPLCLTSYAKEEVHPEVNWPFPSYENGDLFLAWGELGTRAYASYDPSIALRYVRNVLNQYSKDGLAFQRYLRKSQTGAGNDILANNCSIVVGLYRNLYGLQPKHNRILLDPHLPAELSGTKFPYRLRGKEYQIALDQDAYAISCDGWTLRQRTSFAVNSISMGLEYFSATRSKPELQVRLSKQAPLELDLSSWSASPSGARSWTETCRTPGTGVEHIVFGLAPRSEYDLFEDGRLAGRHRSDTTGKIEFNSSFGDAATHQFAIRSASSRQ